MAESRKVLQLRISLEGIEPEIWRRIQVPADCTFWDLHCAIQDSFGWLDSHLHEFRLGGGDDLELRVGILEDEGLEGEMDDEVLPGWEVAVAENLDVGETFLYVYDFGDNWVHEVTFEEIDEASPGRKYPVCLDGKRACPPEDCGGPHGYAEFLKAIRNPKHPEHREMLEWVGGAFDPERFEVKEVCFSDPEERLAILEE